MQRCTPHTTPSPRQTKIPRCRLLGVSTFEMSTFRSVHLCKNFSNPLSDNVAGSTRLYARGAALQARPGLRRRCLSEREFFIDNLLVRIYLIIVMIRWTGLVPWEFDFFFQVALALHLPSYLNLTLSPEPHTTKDAHVLLYISRALIHLSFPIV